MNRVSPFLNWLQTNNKSGFIGEYGIPWDDPLWLPVLNNFLYTLDTSCVGGTYWAGGPWWGSYKLSVEPDTAGDKPQMAVLENYSIACTQTVDIDKNVKVPYKVFPNPTEGFIQILGNEPIREMQLYDSYGILKQIFYNTDNINISNYTTGIYFLITENQKFKIIKF